MLQFFRRAAGHPGRLGILAGTFNPPTAAHLALARAALSSVDEVLFALPRRFPHKAYQGASFEDRIRMLLLALEEEPWSSVAATEQGLFIDIARECRRSYGPGTEFYFLCGRDAAERVVNWNYGRPGAFFEQLREFRLLVAARQGAYQPPAEMRHRIQALALEPGYEEVSATAVRERIKRAEAWERLVPSAIVPLVRQIYRA